MFSSDVIKKQVDLCSPYLWKKQDYVENGRYRFVCLPFPHLIKKYNYNFSFLQYIQITNGQF
jgi:hypothetical protein